MVAHDYSSSAGKVFPSKPEATLDQRSMSANPRLHLLFSSPLSFVSLSPSRCSQRGCCSPQSASCLMVDVTEHTTRWEKGTGGFVAATLAGFIAGMTGPPPPKNDHWMIHEVKCKGGGCVWLHHCCVWASLVSAAVFLTLTRKRDVGWERGGSVCFIGE